MFRILNGRSCILFHFALFDMVASWFGKLRRKREKGYLQMHEYNPTRDYADNCTGNGRNN